MAKDIMALIKGKKQQIAASSGRRDKTVKPQQGKSRWRILPGWRKDGDPTFFHDFGQHFVKNTANELQAVYICTEKTFGKPCDMCQAVANAIEQAPSDDLQKVLTEAKSKGRVLMNALHLDGDNPDEPVILDLTPTTFEKILDLMEEYGAEMLDLAAGTDIVIERKGKGLNTEYSVIAAAKSKAVDKSVLTRLHDLDAYVAQEYEAGLNKALTALGAVSGTTPMLTAGASAALTGGSGSKDKPSTKPTIIEGDYEEASASAKKSAAVEDDEIPFDTNEDEEPKASTATVIVGKATAGDDFNAELGDDDIAGLLADLE